MQNSKDEVIYKLFEKADWDAFNSKGETNGSATDIKDGFLHFSTARQLRKTGQLYYKPENTPQPILALLELKNNLEKEIKWDESKRRADFFPHLYRPLKIEEIKSSWVLERDDKGELIYPAELNIPEAN
eukprot:TRINITY_DN2277_c0_g1_i1.p1 TRINITY_DN2277_c0_g1~~TRINITY_DN2277_c0_g1_i1.p1  ORF type:complete len:146 (-),score=42.60 TRINITY_DN2277_c0_g1_i1:76-462(-)